MGRAVIIIKSERERERAMLWARRAPIGTRIEFKASKRTLPQNDRMWSMLTDVAQQVPWYGVNLKPDEWKLIFLASLKRELRMVPNLDGDGFVDIGRSMASHSRSMQSRMPHDHP